MENKDVLGDKRGFLYNDRLLVCSLLVIYSICIAGFFGVMFGVLNISRTLISANATIGAITAATEQVSATSTAVVRATEQSQYEFIERFDMPSARWYIGPHNRRYGEVLYSIKDGIYIWDVQKSKGFTFSMDFYKGNKIKDFDVYVDTKFVESESLGDLCAGLVFRKPEDDWDEGAFIFAMCNDSHFKIQYYDKDGWKWVTNSDFTNLIQPEDWNRVEVSARDDHFLFMLNNMEVFEMTDDRLQQGSLAIYLEVPDNESALVWFDNFGYQSR